MIDLLLLPSARTIAPELESEFGRIPSGLIPLDGRAALEYIIEPYAERGYTALVAAHDAIDQLSGFLARRPEFPGQIVDVGATASLGETIAVALRPFTGLRHLVINFADTILPDFVPEGDVVAYADQADIYRWTTFELDAQARIGRIIEKEQDKDPSVAVHVFVGVFAFADPADFVRELEAALAAPSSAGIDPFYVAVRAYVAGRSDRRLLFQAVRGWRDLGHLDTYYASKRAHYLGRRFFNDVSVDARRGLVRKTSRHVRKFRNEIGWYVHLPKNLAYLAPRVIDYRMDGDEPFLELEFYGYPTLNDLFLYGNLSAGIWEQILGALEHVLSEFASYTHTPENPADLHAAMREMYETKTRERLAQVDLTGSFAPFGEREIVINGVRCPGVPVVLEQLSETAERLGMYQADIFTIVHGDLCLSNILYDRRHGIVRLIDPRGGFGRYDIYGDLRYDLAKLSHSVLGHYDFIVNGQFTCDITATGVQLQMHDGAVHRSRRLQFAARILGTDAPHVRRVRFIEALLFLSMTPLHADRPKAQAAFLARGLQLYAAVAGDASLQEYLGA